jgi:hypothetical protein
LEELNLMSKITEPNSVETAAKRSLKEIKVLSIAFKTPKII